VKVFGCRPTKMTPRTPGPAYANLQRRKPREGIRRTVRRALSKMVSRVISIRSREFSKPRVHRISDCADLTSESFGANVIMLHLRVGVADHLYPLLALQPAAAPHRASGLVLWHFSDMARCLG
jgi:hypothetical protein